MHVWEVPPSEVSAAVLYAVVFVSDLGEQKGKRLHLQLDHVLTTSHLNKRIVRNSKLSKRS